MLCHLAVTVYGISANLHLMMTDIQLSTIWSPHMTRQSISALLILAITFITLGCGGGGGDDFISGMRVDFRNPSDKFDPPLVFYFDDGDVAWVSYDLNSESLYNNMASRFTRTSNVKRGSYSVIDSGSYAIIQMQFPNNWNLSVRADKSGGTFTYQLPWSNNKQGKFNMRGTASKQGEGMNPFSATSSAMD